MEETQHHVITINKFTDPSYIEKSDVEKVLNEIGTNIDNQQLDLLFSSIGDKPLHELMAAGMEKLLSVPAAGAAVVGGAGAASTEAAKPEDKP